MSRDNMETLRAFYEAINRQDLDDALRCLHPEAELYPAVGGELHFPCVLRGHDGFRQWWEQIHEGFDVTVKIEEVHEAAGDRVLQVELWCPHGREGIDTEIEVSDLYAFRDGLLSRVDGFRERNDALEAPHSSDVTALDEKRRWAWKAISGPPT